MSIAITGASGQLGRLTAERVLEQTDPGNVVLITRDPSKLADLAAKGADVRAGDFTDPASLDAAFAGVETLLLISLDTVGTRVDPQRAAVEKAGQAGVSHIAYTSIVNPSDSNPIGVAAEHLATEEAIRATGLTFTFLRNAIYAEMAVRTAQGGVEHGVIHTNEGGGKVAYVSRADCAAVAAAVLTDDTGKHANKAYDVTGAEALTAEQVAAIAAEIAGRPISVEQIDDEAAVQGMVQHAGFPEPVARVFASFGTGHRLGWSAAVSTTVEELTGRAPQSVRDVLTQALTASAQQSA